MFTLLTYLISLVQGCDPATDSTRIRMKGRWHHTPTPYNDQLRSAVQFMKKVQPVRRLCCCQLRN